MLTLKNLLCLLLVTAQVSSTGRQFEVASIHQLDMNLGDIIRTNRASVTVDGAVASYKAQSPIMLITRAFGILEDQVVGLPETSRGIFFDIEAKIPAAATKEQAPEMLQNLLATRFKMTFHRQEEMRAVFELTSSGANKLQASQGAGPGRCVMESGHRMCRAMTMAEVVAQINNVAQVAKTIAARTALNNPNISNAAADATASWLVDRPLVDKSGLDGRYDFQFDYGGQGPGVPPIRIVDSLSALGLKLVDGKSNFKSVIIDHIDRLPTPN